jgi:hypothetical protein
MYPYVYISNAEIIAIARLLLTPKISKAGVNNRVHPNGRR